MKISGCIVTYNNEDTIEKCISSILENTKDIDFELYVYDNASTDNTVSIIKEKFPTIGLFENAENSGFGHGHNSVLKKMDSDVHFIINPDIYIDMDVFTPMSDYLMDHYTAALITPKVMNADGTEQYLPKRGPTIRYVIISKLPGFKHYRKEYTRSEDEFVGPTNIEFCTGCFFAARTKKLKELKGFNKKYYMYFEDSDLSKRVLQENLGIVFYPNCHVYHDWNRANTKSFKGAFRFLTSMLKYFITWGFEF